MKMYKLTAEQFKNIFNCSSVQFRKWARPLHVAYVQRTAWGGYKVFVRMRWWLYLIILPFAIIYEAIHLLWDGGLVEFEFPYNGTSWTFEREKNRTTLATDILEQVCSIGEAKDS